MCILDFRKTDFYGLGEKLSHIPWLELGKKKSIQERWDILKNEMLSTQLQTACMRREVGNKTSVTAQKAF